MQLLYQWLFTSVWGISLPFKVTTSQFPQLLTTSKLSPCAGQGLSHFCALFLIHFPFKTYPSPWDPFFQSLRCPVNISQSSIVTPWLLNPRLLLLFLFLSGQMLSHHPVAFLWLIWRLLTFSKRRQSSACTSSFLTCRDCLPNSLTACCPHGLCQLESWLTKGYSDFSGHGGCCTTCDLLIAPLMFYLKDQLVIAQCFYANVFKLIYILKINSIWILKIKYGLYPKEYL